MIWEVDAPMAHGYTLATSPMIVEKYLRPKESMNILEQNLGTKDSPDSQLALAASIYVVDMLFVPRGSWKLPTWTDHCGGVFLLCLFMAWLNWGYYGILMTNPEELVSFTCPRSPMHIQTVQILVVTVSGRL